MTLSFSAPTHTHLSHSFVNNALFWPARRVFIDTPRQAEQYRLQDAPRQEEASSQSQAPDNLRKNLQEQAKQLRHQIESCKSLKDDDKASFLNPLNDIDAKLLAAKPADFTNIKNQLNAIKAANSTKECAVQTPTKAEAVTATPASAQAVVESIDLAGYDAANENAAYKMRMGQVLNNKLGSADVDGATEQQKAEYKKDVLMSAQSTADTINNAHTDTFAPGAGKNDVKVFEDSVNLIPDFTDWQKTHPAVASTETANAELGKAKQHLTEEERTQIDSGLAREKTSLDKAKAELGKNHDNQQLQDAIATQEAAIASFEQGLANPDTTKPQLSNLYDLVLQGGANTSKLLEKSPVLPADEQTGRNPSKSATETATAKPIAQSVIKKTEVVRKQPDATDSLIKQGLQSGDPDLIKQAEYFRSNPDVAKLQFGKLSASKTKNLDNVMLKMIYGASLREEGEKGNNLAKNTLGETKITDEDTNVEILKQRNKDRMQKKAEVGQAAPTAKTAAETKTYDPIKDLETKVNSENSEIKSLEAQIKRLEDSHAIGAEQAIEPLQSRLDYLKKYSHADQLADAKEDVQDQIDERKEELADKQADWIDDAKDATGEMGEAGNRAIDNEVAIKKLALDLKTTTDPREKQAIQSEIAELKQEYAQNMNAMQKAGNNIAFAEKLADAQTNAIQNAGYVPIIVPNTDAAPAKPAAVNQQTAAPAKTISATTAEVHDNDVASQGANTNVNVQYQPANNSRFISQDGGSGYIQPGETQTVNGVAITAGPNGSAITYGADQQAAEPAKTVEKAPEKTLVDALVTAGLRPRYDPSIQQYRLETPGNQTQMATWEDSGEKFDIKGLRLTPEDLLKNAETDSKGNIVLSMTLQEAGKPATTKRLLIEKKQ